MKKPNKIPKTSKIFNAVVNVYSVNRSPEYITYLSLHNTGEYRDQLGPFLVLASAAVNGTKCTMKTPNDMTFIRNCFKGITRGDILLLPNVDSNWKRIEIKMWNKNDITFNVI